MLVLNRDNVVQMKHELPPTSVPPVATLGAPARWRRTNGRFDIASLASEASSGCCVREDC